MWNRNTPVSGFLSRSWRGNPHRPLTMHVQTLPQGARSQFMSPYKYVINRNSPDGFRTDMARGLRTSR